MSADTGCCGSDIKTWARIISIVGIVLCALSLFLSLLFWFFIPSSISLLVAFILVVVGLNRDRPGNLTAANVILGINIAVDAFIAVCCIYLAIDVPQEVIDNLNNNTGNWGDAKTDLRIVYSVFAAFLFAIIGLLIFAFVIFRKARLHLVQNPRRCSVFPVTFAGHPPPHSSPVCVVSPPYPAAAPPYSVTGYPSSVYGANPPSYPYNYNGTPQLPPRGYNIDSAAAPPMYPQGYPMNFQAPMPVYNANPVPVMHRQNNDSSPTVYQNESKTNNQW